VALQVLDELVVQSGHRLEKTDVRKCRRRRNRRPPKAREVLNLIGEQTQAQPRDPEQNEGGDERAVQSLGSGVRAVYSCLAADPIQEAPERLRGLAGGCFGGLRIRVQVNQLGDFARVLHVVLEMGLEKPSVRASSMP